jgi:L-alanine-DL-glutamate epimerase-like enolase superfamily enzyme
MVDLQPEPYLDGCHFSIENTRAEGLTWIEAPTCSHDFTGHSAIARKIQTPIQADENWWGSSDLRQVLALPTTSCWMR